MLPQDFSYFAPRTLAEAMQRLEEGDPESLADVRNLVDTLRAGEATESSQHIVLRRAAEDLLELFSRIR